MTAGAKIDELVVNTDFAPTFADLAGAEFPSDERSLAPLLRGQVPSWRSTILLEGLDDDDEGRDEAEEKSRRKTEGTPRSLPTYKAVRTGTHKYTEYETGEKELYNLEADPHEMENAYETTESSLVRDLEKKLDALRNCAGEGCRETEDAP